MTKLSEQKAQLQKLNKRVDQQEEVIAQLIKIVAATNDRMTKFIEKDVTKEKSPIIN